MDDWRGEHLIRSRPKEPGMPMQAVAHGGSMVKRSSEARICAVPDCGAKLYPENVTGVCRRHNHQPDHCGCRDCVAARERGQQ